MNNLAASSNEVVSFEDEKLILVDEDDNEIGNLAKDKCHDGRGQLHRAFSLFIFNRRGEAIRIYVDEREMDYQLFSDPSNAVGREYGIPNPMDGMTGIEEPRPAVFLLDDERTVEYAWVASEWPDFPDYDAVEAAIDALV